MRNNWVFVVFLPVIMGIFAFIGITGIKSSNDRSSALDILYKGATLERRIVSSSVKSGDIQCRYLYYIKSEGKELELGVGHEIPAEVFH